eukprot:scaffold95914_cov36-Prasinocladus_malaysianus.AAC.1
MVAYALLVVLTRLLSDDGVGHGTSYVREFAHCSVRSSYCNEVPLRLETLNRAPCLHSLQPAPLELGCVKDAHLAGVSS